MNDWQTYRYDEREAMTAHLNNQSLPLREREELHDGIAVLVQEVGCPWCSGFHTEARHTGFERHVRQPALPG